MKFNTDTVLAKANARIINLEKRGESLLSKVDVVYRENVILKAEIKVLMSKVEYLATLNKQLSEENAQLKKPVKNR